MELLQLCRGLKVQVIGQANAVGLTSTEGSFLVLFGCQHTGNYMNCVVYSAKKVK